MHIEVGDFHPELQHQVPRLRRIAQLMRVPGVIRIFDWLRRREAGSDVAGLDCSTVNIPSSLDNYSIRTRIYRPSNVSGPLPCLVYFHGGGYIMGLPEVSAELIKLFIQTRPCVVVAPDYRKAHQKPFPGGFQDCYDALIWARDNADSLGCSDKILIGGHSAGGGLTAAVALKARDTGDVDVAFQMPFYPMIDDTQPTDPQRDIDPPVWDTALNAIGWGAYLRGLRGRGEIPSAYAAPALNPSLAYHPPSLMWVIKTPSIGKQRPTSRGFEKLGLMWHIRSTRAAITPSSTLVREVRSVPRPEPSHLKTSACFTTVMLLELQLRKFRSRLSSRTL